MIIHKRRQSELFFPLVLAWSVYAFAQKDLLLPALALLLVGSAYLTSVFSRKAQKPAKLKMSVRSIINISVLLGAVWRNFMPPPEEAVAFVPILVSAVQSASIFISVMVWFSSDYKYRTLYLRFLPWLTVATSINIPFNPLVQLAFWIFCVTAIAMIILPMYLPYSSELKEKMQKTKHKSLFIYAYPIFLAIISTAVFILLVVSVRIGDELFMDLIMDYARVNQHFRFFDSKLLLAGAGNSRSDIRPIMEVERKDVHSGYLAGQVFTRYRDGLWEAPFDLATEEIPSEASEYSRTLEITMFEYLRDIIPAPRGVVAIQGKNTNFRIDPNGLVLNTDKNIPRARLLLDSGSIQKPLKEFDAEPYVQMDAMMKEKLQNALKVSVGDVKAPHEIARRIEYFFRANFQYNLDVNFKADNRGILYMIYRKRPAYCSYFATAMILMLRAEGIPARMAAGFYANEVSSWNKDRYIVRGRDAHAWVEALMPVIDFKTGQLIKNARGEALYEWKRYDPTPASSRQLALEQDKKINRIADWVWCAQKRMRAAILNMETKTLVRILFLLVGFLIFEEVFKKLIKGWRNKHRMEKEILSIKENPQKIRCLRTYQEFEKYLKDRYSVERKDAETDRELVDRLGEIEIPEKERLSIKDFLHNYHAARFGMKKDVNFQKW